MSLQEEIRPYLDADGFVSHSPTYPGQINSSGNACLYTGIYFILLRLNLHDVHKNEDDPLAIMHKFYAQKLWPVLNRGPHSPDKNTSIDDYTGFLAFCSFYWPEEAKAWLEYGKNHLGIFNADPDLKWWKEPKRYFKQCMFRFPQLVAHAKWAAGLEPGLLLRTIWKYVVKKQMKESEPDGYLLTWLLVLVASNKSNDKSILQLCLDWRNSVYKRLGDPKEIIKGTIPGNPVLAEYHIL